MESVKDKVAFITGAASGIGYAMAAVFAGQGMKVVLADVEARALDTACATLAAGGAEVSAVQVDVTDREKMADARDAALERFGAVHILCNNAGVNVAGALHEVTYRDWDWVLGVNLGGVVNGVTTFLPELMRHGSDAHIVNTASVGGLVGMVGLGIYNAGKFAVVGLSEALRADLLDNGVGVSVLCPGVVRSALSGSERNRPTALFNDPPQLADSARAAVAEPDGPLSGTDPMDLAEQVLAGVLAGRFFLCTHPEFKDIVAERNAAVDCAFADHADPAMVTAMRGLVRPIPSD
ncbi:MAG: SDR family NAD(P)-dependent oxidoreductase [Gammaproteobacteria bacterium]|nr:SDR family NAD(P)-dependent oxidoreductase [Gammaproteobacteria bacterium]